MGLHTGEPTVGEEGYHGLDVVRAARICSAGHGGQILLSETTRALLGNDLPAAVSVHDLGEQHLKDIQQEHVYELRLNEAAQDFPPLKQSSTSSSDELARKFEERIHRHVEDTLEAAFDKALSGPPKGRPRHGCFPVLLLVAGAIAALVLVVQLVL